MEGIAITIYLILALWIIPVYVGKKRKIGYMWSMLACLLISPIIGLIITLISPRIDK